MLELEKMRLKRKSAHFVLGCRRVLVKLKEADIVERKLELCDLQIRMHWEQQKQMRQIKCQELWEFVLDIEKVMHLIEIYKRSSRSNGWKRERGEMRTGGKQQRIEREWSSRERKR